MRIHLLILTLAVFMLAANSTYAQKRTSRNEAKEQEPLKLPKDPQLVKIHQEFVSKAEKLGDEYARKRDWDKSRVVFEEILKLVPNYPPAIEKIKVINDRLSSAEKEIVAVKADGDWQDTGIKVNEGSPLTFTADGEWTFVFEGDANGIEIPRELRDYRLGSLIGVVVDSPNPGKDTVPFTIGKQRKLNAPKTGRLFVKMLDFDNSDNNGVIKLTITGTFE